MSAKHFINDPTHLVNTALLALTLTNPSLALDEIRKAIMSRVDGEKGILVTVMNYTGDVLNFGMGVEKAKAAGLKVEMLVVGDDVGVGRAAAGKVGRRGIAGTVLVHKISGALAARGASLEDVERAKVDLPELVKRMLAQMLDPKDKDRAFLNVNSNETVLLINNLGSISVLELGGITAEVVAQLEKNYNIKPVRILAGTYMTSLNGLGFSITILNVVNTDIVVGDGDCGIGLKRGAECQILIESAVLNFLSTTPLTSDPVLDLSKIVQVVETSMDGTSGALYAIFLNALASLGRTVYIGGSGFEEVPDPGAWGLSEFLLGLAGFKNEEGYEMV
ncbi:dihydroxyacetone kinase [Diplocarpon rosae]|nr:dihydroxyacetone kinase [Diplocarpon rosae]